MRRSIPPRTMRDVSRSRRKQRGPVKTNRLVSGFGITGRISGARQSGPPGHDNPVTTPLPTGRFQKPRNWKFQTKPLFKKIKGPLVDVFHEAEEVLIVVDLCGFARRDVSLSMSENRYLISACTGDQSFLEEIPLPPEVDLEKCVENFRNGILEIVIPRKKVKGLK
jgi:HSP20 family molecular chaperone IbpA